MTVAPGLLNLIRTTTMVSAAIAASFAEELLTQDPTTTKAVKRIDIDEFVTQTREVGSQGPDGGQGEAGATGTPAAAAPKADAAAAPKADAAAAPKADAAAAPKADAAAAPKKEAGAAAAPKADAAAAAKTGTTDAPAAAAPNAPAAPKKEADAVKLEIMDDIRPQDSRSKSTAKQSHTNRTGSSYSNYNDLLDKKHQEQLRHIDGENALDYLSRSINTLEEASQSAAIQKDPTLASRIQKDIGIFMTLFNMIIDLQRKIVFMYAKAGKGWTDKAEQFA